MWRVYLNGVVVNVFLSFEKAHAFANELRYNSKVTDQIKMKRMSNV